MRIHVKIDEKKQDSDPTAWKLLPLRISTEKDTRGLFYLVVPKEYEGKRYKVVLANNGKPEFYHNPNKLDPDRIFAATLLIDGVNSWMRPEGKDYRFVSGHPNTLTKWVLTSPGKRLIPDKAGTRGRVEGARVAAVNGVDGSEVHVLGFQKGSDVAGSFVFAKPVESVAAPELLSSNKIGTMAVYFFAERFAKDLDRMGGGNAGAGTKMGPDVSSPTFRVKVLYWYPRPVETWHIIYRYEGDPLLPRGLKAAE